MRVLFSSLLLFFTLLAPALGLQEKAKPLPVEKPLLWTVEGKGLKKPSYLFGTIHVPDPRVMAFSPLVLEALKQSDAFYAELAMEPEKMLKIVQDVMLPGADTVKNHLPADLYARCEKLFASRRLPIGAFHKYKVWYFALQLELVDVIIQMQGRLPMDIELYNKAKNAGKEVGGLEIIEEQTRMLDSLTAEEQVDLVRGVLEIMEKPGADPIEDVIQAYLTGDVGKIMELVEKNADPDDPLDKKFMDIVFVKRNRNMANRFMKKLAKHPDKSYFIAVGAGHYADPEGILTLLRKQGYTVTQVKNESKVPLGAGQGDR